MVRDVTGQELALSMADGDGERIADAIQALGFVAFLKTPMECQPERKLNQPRLVDPGCNVSRGRVRRCGYSEPLQSAWVGKPANACATIAHSTPFRAALDIALIDIVGKPRMRRRTGFPGCSDRRARAAVTKSG